MSDVTLITLCDLHGNAAVAEAMGASLRTLEDMRAGVAPLTSDDIHQLAEVFKLTDGAVRQIAKHNAQQRLDKGKARVQRRPRKNQATSNRLAKT